MFSSNTDIGEEGNPIDQVIVSEVKVNASEIKSHDIQPPVSQVVITTTLTEETGAREESISNQIQITPPRHLAQKDQSILNESHSIRGSDISIDADILHSNQVKTDLPQDTSPRTPAEVSSKITNTVNISNESNHIPHTLSLISDNAAVDRLTVPDAVPSVRRCRKKRASLTSKSVSVTMSAQGGTGIQTEIRKPPSPDNTPPISPLATDDAINSDEFILDNKQDIKPQDADANKEQSCTEWMRRRRIKESTRRREQLDGEPVVVYRKHVDIATNQQQQQLQHHIGHGHHDVVATVVAHKRKRFALPSLDDRYARYRMLKQQEQDRVLQKEKLQEFMMKIRKEGYIIIYCSEDK